MPISVIFTPIYFLCLAPQVVFVCGHVVLAQCANEGGGGGRGHTDSRTLFANVRAKLFCHAIYCTNPRFDARSQSGSWSHRIMGGRVTQIVHEYDSTTVITIKPILHPRRCKIDSSIFSDMSEL